MTIAPDGTVINAGIAGLAGEPFDAVVGKALAARVLGENHGSLKGLELKLGGEGLKRIYDVDLKNVANSLPALKKAGVKVGTTDLVFRGKKDDAAVEGPSRGTVPVPSIDITNDIRDQVQRGQPLFDQPPNRNAKASIEFLPSGVALHRALNAPDLSSVVHEMFHEAEQRAFDPSAAAQNWRDLHGITQDDLDAYAEWSGAKKGSDGNWQRTTESKEKGARGWERFVYDGWAPTEAIKALFQKLAAWMRNIYKVLKGSSIDVDIGPAREFYEKLVTRMSPEERAALAREKLPRDERDTGVLYQQDEGETPQSGFWNRRRQRLAREEAEKQPIVTFGDDAEARYQAAKGEPKTPALAKLQERIGNIVKARHHFPEINPSESAVKATVNELLLEQERADKWAQTVAYNRIAAIVDKMTLGEVDLFSRALIVPDIQEDITRGLYDEGNPLPFFKNAAEVAGAQRVIDQAVQDHPAVQEALQQRNAFVRDLTQELVDAKLLKPDALENPVYYHRRVMDHLGLIRGLGSPRSEVRPTLRGFQRQRTGGGDFNTAYHESEFEWVSQALAELKTKDTLDTLKSLLDITPALKREAKATNERRLGEKLATLAGVSSTANPMEFNELAKVFAKEALQPYRQRMAIATRGVLEAMLNGQYDADDAPYLKPAIDELIDAYSDWKEENRDVPVRDREPFDASHPQWWDLIKHFATQVTDAGDSARSIFKTIHDRENYLAETLGRKYVDRTDPASLHQLAPKDGGYVLHQPIPGNQFYRATGIDERVFDQVLAGMRDLKPEDKKKLTAVGGKKETWIIPDWLSKTLKDFNSDPRARGDIARALESAGHMTTNAWKQTQLFAPTRALKYNLNNTTGDLDAALAYSPGVLLHLKPNAAFLYRTMYKRALPTAAERTRIERLTELGVLHATQTAYEIPDINDLPAFERLATDDPVSFMRRLAGYVGLGGPVGGYLDFVRKATMLRENMLRLAAYDYLLKQVQAGVKTYAASNKTRVDTLRGDIAKAKDGPEKVAAQERLTALLARDLIGDYQAVSAATKYARTRFAPFLSFQEINFKRYYNLLKNIPREEGTLAGRAGRVAGAAAGAVGGVAARVAVSFGIKALLTGLAVNAFILGVGLWNELMFPDETDELRDKGRQQMHLILGRNDDGSINTLRVEGALSSMLSWFDLQNWPQKLQDLAQGDLDAGEAIADTGKAVINKGVQALSPFTRMLYEQMMRQSTFPDAFHPAPIRDRAEHLASLVALDWLYQEVTGMPSPPEKWLTRLLIYRTDPGEAAYHEIRADAAKWMDTQGRESTGGGATTAIQNALYYYKRAHQWGDDQAADKWWDRYVALGGSEAGLSTSVANAEPLHSVPQKSRAGEALRDEYVSQLSPRKQRVLQLAQEWYATTYGDIPVRHRRAQ
jgi:hypothetical protein